MLQHFKMTTYSSVKSYNFFFLNANEITVGIIFNKKKYQLLNRLQLPVIEVQVKCCTW